MEETKDISNPKQEKEQKQSIEKELKAKEKYFGWKILRTIKQGNVSFRVTSIYIQFDALIWIQC